MSNFDTTSISRGGLKLYFNTDVLSDEALKARVASEVKSLGALFEPDFAKQVMEGRGLTLRRIYCYELAVSCDTTVATHVHYSQWEKRKTGEWDVSKTSSGNYKVEEVEKLRYVEYDYDDTNTYKDTLVGMKCMIYPDSKFNTIIGQSTGELDWAKELLNGSLKNYSTQARIEYAGASDFFTNLSDETINSTLTSKIVCKGKIGSNETFRFMNINNYYLEKSVARIGVAKYYIYVSYKGKNYNLELDDNGKIVIEKSTFPMSHTIYAKSISKKDIHQSFLNFLTKQGNEVDSEYFNFVSKIENIELEPTWEESKIARVRLDLKATAYGASEQSKYLGAYFCNVYDFGRKIIPTCTIMEKFRECSADSDEYKYSSQGISVSLASKTPNEKSFPNEKEELARLFDKPDIVIYSVEKSSVNREDAISIVSISEYKISVHYENEVYTAYFDSTGSIKFGGVESFKFSQKHIEKKVDFLKKELKSPAKRFVFPFATIVMILLSLWQTISLWWLNRYDFIQGNGQSIAMNIFAVASLIAMFISLCILIKHFTNMKKASSLCKRYSLGEIFSKKDCRELTITFCDLDFVYGSFFCAIIGTVLFLVPFIIFIFV